MINLNLASSQLLKIVLIAQSIERLVVCSDVTSNWVLSFGVVIWYFDWQRAGPNELEILSFRTSEPT